MDCKQAIEIISAYADGELDSNQRADAERHIGQCAQCGQALEGIQALKNAMRVDALKFNAPGPLLKRVGSLLDKAVDPPGTKPPPRQRWMTRPKWIAFAAGVLGIAALVTIYLTLWPSSRQRIEAEAVARYQQTVQANNVVEIASSDPKTVINWFAGKLNFTPLPPNQPPVGFTLVGGRVDNLGGQAVAALVYRNGSHLSQIFEWPASGTPSQGSPRSVGGLSVASWNGSDWAFCAVSDDAATPVAGFSNLFTEPGCGPR